MGDASDLVRYKSASGSVRWQRWFIVSRRRIHPGSGASVPLAEGRGPDIDPMQRAARQVGVDVLRAAAWWTRRDESDGSHGLARLCYASDFTNSCQRGWIRSGR
jgi:hypothetical protein